MTTQFSTFYNAILRKYTILVVIFSLFLGISNIPAQTFTNVVNKVVNNQVTLTYSYHSDLPIHNPLEFFMTISHGYADKVSGVLSHNSVEYNLFSNIPSTNPLTIENINLFSELPQDGKWQFHLNTDSTLTIHSWGIVEQVPEPGFSTLGFLGGILIIMSTFRKRYVTTKGY